MIDAATVMTHINPFETNQAARLSFFRSFAQKDLRKRI